MRAFILVRELAKILSADNLLRQFSRFQQDVRPIVFESSIYIVLIRHLEFRTQPRPCIGDRSDRR